jgi:hypothetical protein
MIVGNGLIAKAFYENYANNDDVLIFASGVSNSSNTDPKEFLREKTLLESHLAEEKKIVYFSTCSIEDPSLEKSPYILHKLQMEELVKGVNDYLIFRLPQLAGKTDNPNTLLNFLYRKINNQEFFEIYAKASRNIVDIDDIKSIASYIINGNQTKNNIENLAQPIYINVTELVNLFENILSKKALYKVEDNGSVYHVKNTLMLEVANKLNINFNSDYMKKILMKYYQVDKVGV